MLSLYVLLVLDTNVLFQALYSQNGASFEILSLILSAKIHIALSVPVFLEYESVLKRKANLEKFELTTKDVDDVLSALAYIGRKFGIFFAFSPNLRDAADNKFMDLAIRASVDYIVTSNTRDFTVKPDLNFPRTLIQTPAQFLKIWRKNHE
jgi:putative PIN family toxin of toxin-antitoxin system